MSIFDVHCKKCRLVLDHFHYFEIHVMDAYNVFENIDLLNYLISPIRNSFTCLRKDFFLKKLRHDKILYHKNDKHIKLIRNRSSLSDFNIFIQDTSKYCTPTSRNNKDLFGKSVVKVTIIPKIPFKLKSKASNFPNSKSISNHESSTKTLNLFSSRENRKRVTSEYCLKSDKRYILTYEDKCTGTYPINMKKTRYKNIGYTRLNTRNRKDDCECKLDDENAQKSRVTIVGQLGLTQDERYVLNCSATVNDEPIATNVTRKYNSQNRLDMKQNMNEFPVNKSNEYTNKRMATQGTQVNLIIKNNKIEKRYRDQTMQCNCNETGTLLPALEGNVLKECKSPLVIISIYPRENDTEDVNANPIQIIQHQSSPKHISKGYNDKISNADNGKQKVENSHSEYRSKQIQIRSRSPSPAVKNRNDFLHRTRGVDVLTTNNFTKKQNPQTPKNLNKLVVQSNDVKQITSFNNKKSFTRKSEVNRHHYDKQNQNNHRINNDEQNINTEQVKKALVRNFLKNIDDVSKNVSKSKLIIPKDRASKITVNIDVENENYDVMFEQSKFDTGLTVRKKAKIKHKHKSKEKDKVNSVENFLTLPDDTIVESRFRQPNSSFKILPTKPRLNVRDSLEINHRKGGRDSRVTKRNNKYVKNINNDDTKPSNKLFEPVKPFRGDDCSLLDPNERDRDVRELLGTFRRANKERPYHIYTVAQDKDYGCVKKCSKSLMTGCSIAKFLSNENTKNEDNTKSILTMPSKPDFFLSRHENFISRNDYTTQQNTHSNVSTIDPYKSQNLILSRNVQVFLQVEQFNKARPIILTRKQYGKVKKTIRCTISKKLSLKKSKNGIKNMVSVGEVKIKPKLYQPLQLEREIQTDKTEIKKLRRKNKKPKNDQVFNLRDSELNIRNDKTKNNDLLSTDVKKKNSVNNNETRKVVSSIEIHCRSVDYMKHVAVSSTCFGENERKSIQSSNKQKNNLSIHTIFKGHKKCVTPNLGTSAYSLNSYRTSIYDFIKPSDAGDHKAKKPFLRRLISCFVMRAHTSEFKSNAMSLRKHTRMTSSVDSYQINTSLGGLEISSSLYDTSISFYSNHNVLPVNKSKRGFFSSVRGFLASRRS